jgi:hypothetical protein
VDEQAHEASARVSVGSTVTVPGRLTLQVALAAGAPEREVTGFVVLTRGADRRRIPYWFRIASARLAGEQHKTLARPGTFRGDTRGRPARVSTYRYPDDPSPLGVPTRLAGPEQVFRVTIRRAVANFGVAVLSQAAGSSVQPRIVVAGTENRLTGYPALPLNLNPYLPSFGALVPSSGAILPRPGSYDVVFDTQSKAKAGRFTFRFWVGDTTPPVLRLLTPTTRGTVRLSVVDRGAGVDPHTFSVTVDGRLVRSIGYDRAHNRASFDESSLSKGRHTLFVQVSDYQETKNMEDVPRILPNTRVLRTTFVLR